MATALIRSFVDDIMMPPFAVILPINKNIDEKFLLLKKGQNYNATIGYNTPAQARADGAVVMAYGLVTPFSIIPPGS